MSIQSRRGFLKAILPGSLAIGLYDPLTPASWDNAASPPFPLAEKLRLFLDNQKEARTSFKESRIRKGDYLRIAEGIVKFFAAHQDARGAIIDPYEGKERQYSTPSFACAASILHASGLNKSFLPQAISDIGGFVVPVIPDFHKIFANAGGMYLEIDTNADGRYNPTGLLRVHRREVNPQIGPSDGCAKNKVYLTPRLASQSLSICPAWKGSDGQWHKLADYTNGAVKNANVKVLEERPNRVEFELTYSGDFHGCIEVKQRFHMTPDRIEVTDTLKGEITSMRQYFPLLVSDGERNPEITISGNRAAVRLGNSVQTFQVMTGGEQQRLNVREPFRNGELDAVYVETRNRESNYVIRPHHS